MGAGSSSSRGVSLSKRGRKGPMGKKETPTPILSGGKEGYWSDTGGKRYVKTVKVKKGVQLSGTCLLTLSPLSKGEEKKKRKSMKRRIFGALSLVGVVKRGRGVRGHIRLLFLLSKVGGRGGGERKEVTIQFSFLL